MIKFNQSARLTPFKTLVRVWVVSAESLPAYVYPTEWILKAGLCGERQPKTSAKSNIVYDLWLSYFKAPGSVPPLFGFSADDCSYRRSPGKTPETPTWERSLYKLQTFWSLTTKFWDSMKPPVGVAPSTNRRNAWTKFSSPNELSRRCWCSKKFA